MRSPRFEAPADDSAIAANRSRIYSLIWRLGPVSRSDLVRETGLTKSTVSSHVDDLIARGMIRQSGTRDSGAAGGRRAILLEIDAHSHVVAAVHIGVRHTTVVLADAAGREVQAVTKRTSRKSAPTAIREIAGLVRGLLAQHPAGSSRLAAVGVAVPGIVHPDAGTCVIAPNLGWRDVPVAALLQAELGVPVLVNNTAQAMAVAESQHVGHRGDGSPDLALIYVGTGVGSAVVNHGELYRGRTPFSGEIGHISVGSGVACACGGTGCLETMVSGPAIARRAAELGLGAGPAPFDISPESIGRAAAGGDRGARRLLDDVGRELGRAAAWLVQTAGPDTLVVAGGVSALGSLLMEPLRAGLREAALDLAADSVTVRRSFLDSGGKLRGAVLIALQQVDDRPTRNVALDT